MQNGGLANPCNDVMLLTLNKIEQPAFFRCETARSHATHALQLQLARHCFCFENAKKSKR
jgi:hypothetical protein